LDEAASGCGSSSGVEIGDVGREFDREPGGDPRLFRGESLDSRGVVKLGDLGGDGSQTGSTRLGTLRDNPCLVGLLLYMLSERDGFMTGIGFCELVAPGAIAPCDLPR